MIIQRKKYLPRTSSAVAIFNRMVPTWPQIEHSLRRENWAKAKDLLHRWIQFHPSDAKAWFLLGDVHYCLMNFVEMDRCFLRTVKCNPDYKAEIDKKREIVWSFLIAEGIRLEKEKKEEPALDKLLLAARILPDRFTAYRLAGEIAFKIGNLGQAKILFEKAIELKPQSRDIYSMLDDIETVLSQNSFS